MTNIRVGRQSNRTSILGHFSSDQPGDHPASYPVPPGIQRAGYEADQLHLVPQLRMNGALRLLSHISLWCDLLAELAAGFTVRGSNPQRGGEIFRTLPDRPWGSPSLLYNGPGGKTAGALTTYPI